MRRNTRRAVGATVAMMAALATSVALAPPAGADVSDCELVPEAPYGNVGGGGVFCPAGAGTFTYRAVVDCYDGYPNPSNPQYIGTYYGPWVQASMTEETSSTVPCNGYVPGSGIGFNTRVEVR
ncbi:hypothetical protein [Streptomyces sp. 6N223]|uniref:hypothetical protein n=1 Tax=Streptomyces sp. 6N223 TaxID=3457412 RepID=UPI003FD17CB8